MARLDRLPMVREVAQLGAVLGREFAYEMLRDQPGLRPAPYLASRGMKWIQHFSKPGLSDADLKDYLRHSHHIVALGLSKKKQRELGLI